MVCFVVEFLPIVVGDFKEKDFLLIGEEEGLDRFVGAGLQG